MAKINVGCRLPNGIILDLYKPFPKEIVEGVRNGTIKNPPPPEFISSTKLNGQNQKWIDLKMLDKAVIFPEDYGVTEVDESFWTQWSKQNAESPMIKNNVLFVVERKEDAEKVSKELSKEIKTGFEAASETDFKIEKASA